MSSGWMPVGSGGARAPELDRPGSLVAFLRRGDQDARAGFYDAHIESVRSYCALICAAEDLGAASDAAFVDFTGRLAAHGEEDPDLEVMLAAATRAAAAARYAHSPDSTATCLTVPELLAARANHELEHGESSLSAHIAQCAVCRETEAKMAVAERVFGGGDGRAAPFASSVPAAAEPEPQPEPEPEPPSQAEPASQAEPPPQPEPPPMPPTAVASFPPAPTKTVRRTGGLLGTGRSMARRLRGKSGP